MKRWVVLLALSACFGGTDITPIEVALGAAAAVAQPMAVANLSLASPLACAPTSPVTCAAYPCSDMVAVTIGPDCPLPLADGGQAIGTVQVQGSWMTTSSMTATLDYDGVIALQRPVIVVDVTTVSLMGAAGSTMTVTYVGDHIHTNDNPLSATSSWTITVDGTDPASLRYTINGTDQAAGAGAQQITFTDVVLDPTCRLNPISGSATLQSVSLTNIKQTQVEFHAACDGTADVTPTTGAARPVPLDFAP